MDRNSDSSSPRSYSSSSLGSSNAPYAEVECGASSLHLLNNRRHSKTKGGQSRRCFNAVAVTSLVLSIISLLSVGLVFCWYNFIYPEWKQRFFADNDSEQEREVCVSCLQISPNPLEAGGSPELWEELEVKVDPVNESKICCAATPRQYALMFKLILQRQEEIKKIADLEDSARTVKQEDNQTANSLRRVNHSIATSAHLVFKAPSLTDKDSKKAASDALNWKSPSESPTSHVTEGIKFHDNRLWVQSPGRYFVYCQVMTLDHSPAKQRLLSAYVQRHSILRPQTSGIVLKLRHTRRDVSTDRHSSYVGAVMELHTGDELYVRASRPDALSHDDVASFFGLFKVGPL